MSENNVHIFIKNYFIAKKCWPSFEPLASCNFFAGGRSYLYTDGCWLTRVVAAEGWNGCGSFLK